MGSLKRHRARCFSSWYCRTQLILKTNFINFGFLDLLFKRIKCSLDMDSKRNKIVSHYLVLYAIGLGYGSNKGLLKGTWTSNIYDVSSLTPCSYIPQTDAGLPCQTWKWCRLVKDFDLVRVTTAFLLDDSTRTVLSHCHESARARHNNAVLERME